MTGFLTEYLVRLVLIPVPLAGLTLVLLDLLADTPPTMPLFLIVWFLWVAVVNGVAFIILDGDPW